MAMRRQVPSMLSNKCKSNLVARIYSGDSLEVLSLTPGRPSFTILSRLVMLGQMKMLMQPCETATSLLWLTEKCSSALLDQSR